MTGCDAIAAVDADCAFEDHQGVLVIGPDRQEGRAGSHLQVDAHVVRVACVRSTICRRSRRRARFVTAAPMSSRGRSARCSKRGVTMAGRLWLRDPELDPATGFLLWRVVGVRYRPVLGVGENVVYHSELVTS